MEEFKENELPHVEIMKKDVECTREKGIKLLKAIAGYDDIIRSIEQDELTLEDLQHAEKRCKDTGDFLFRRLKYMKEEIETLYFEKDKRSHSKYNEIFDIELRSTAYNVLLDELIVAKLAQAAIIKEGTTKTTTVLAKVNSKKMFL